MKSLLARILMSISIPILLVLLFLTPRLFHTPTRLSAVQADTPLTASPGGWIKGDDCLVFFDSRVVVARLSSITPAKRYSAHITSDQITFPTTGDVQAYQQSMKYDAYIDMDVPILLVDGVGLIPA